MVGGTVVNNSKLENVDKKHSHWFYFPTLCVTATVLTYEEAPPQQS